MTVPHSDPSGFAGGTSPRLRSIPTRRLVGFLGLAAGLLALVCAVAAPPTSGVRAADPVTTKPKETLVGGMPLFGAWPKDQKPDAVIVLTGQTFGYLQPCGCSRPQTGGLERRAQFIESLKAKGWPVAGVDLGDLYPETVALSEQGKLKYKATMNALRDMGYVAVGIGQTEIKADLIGLLAAYALQKEQRPFVLAGNACGVVQGKLVAREKHFPIPPGATRPLVDQIEVARVGEVSVGVAGVVGKAIRDENVKQKWDTELDFTDAKKAIEGARDAIKQHAAKPQLNVLIFQGPSGDAARVAADFPEFQIVLCRSDSDLPPLKPQCVNHKNEPPTFVVQAGHRGQYVYVIGAFKKAKGGFDLHYQLVPMGEEHITPGTEEEALKRNKALQALGTYAKDVKAANLLPQYPRNPHPAQIHAAALKPPVKLTYVGTDACKECHAAEFNKWKAVPHSQAMATLEKVAKRPNLRQFDGECVKCHTVGFDHTSGYVDEKATPLLRDVGCESCHGPGSGHVAAPKDKNFLSYMSPWKQGGAVRLPNAAFMKTMADTAPQDRGKNQIPPAQELLIRSVDNMCMRCHDHESDPHFDLYKNWLKIDHSGLAPPGGWPAVPPKKK
jgi:hypothetical protein